MPVPLSIVGSRCQDSYLQNYRVNADFFDLNDYIFHAAATAADLYRQEKDGIRQELRADRMESVISFDASFLLEQFVEVKKNKDYIEWVGDLKFSALSFPYDNQSIGIQQVYDAKSGIELERSNVSETYLYQYQPRNNRLFFRIDQNKIKIFTKGECNIQAVRILYVPNIDPSNPDVLLPDAIVSIVVDKTVLKFKGWADKIIKQSIDENKNKVIQTEANVETAR